jgi:hypothetical protein
MSVKLFTLNGWPSSPTTDNTVRDYDIDSGIWSTSHATTPFVGKVTSTGTQTQFGAWDGNRWYVISPTGGLYAYTPATDTWSGILAGSGAIIGGTVEDANWVMTSDGTYVYILSNQNDFRRYDPNSDTLSALATPPGTAYATTLFLTYDGSGSIYGSKGGGNPAAIAKYDIATNIWTQIASGGYSTDMGNGFATWAFYLQGNLWMLQIGANVNTLRAYQYVVSGNTWITKATQTINDVQRPCGPGHEQSDSSIRVWPDDTGNPSYVYDTITNTYAAGANSPVAFKQGLNWAVTRAWNAAFVWYEQDGTTLLATTVNLGSAVLGETITYHIKVKTPVARAAGVTVSVPPNITTDAEDSVTICATSNGTFGTSFSTGALALNDTFDVFLRLTATSQQSLGLTKRFALKITPNG